MKLSRISDIQWQTLKEKEHEIKEANEKLKQAEELRKQLLTDISHELKTPLSSVQGYAKALIDGVVAPEQKYFEQIYDNVLVVNQLIRDLFQLSMLKANQMTFQMQIMPLWQWIEPMMKRFDQEISRCRVRVEIVSLRSSQNQLNDVQIRMDRIRMDQVMTNLLHNAFRYSPDGGDISVRFIIDADMLRTEVIDSGIGIDEKEIPLIFDRLYRADGASGADESGTGLGLAICREIVSRHGGEIGATSQKGQGSTFYFSLPLMN